MTLSRRYQTAKKIQITAVNLAVEKGLQNLTTEEISLVAGISPRTFFNYYQYKEAAIFGPPLHYPEKAVNALIQNKDTNLLQSLITFTNAHLNRYKNDKNLIKNILNISRNDPKLKVLINNQILFRRDELTEILVQRFPEENGGKLYILSSAVIAATNYATQQWAAGQENDLLKLAEFHLSQIVSATDLLT